MSTIRLISWNVNGIRSVISKGFWEWLEAEQPDVLCLQETRIQEDQLTQRMRAPADYHAFWNQAEKKGYSGVSTFTREAPKVVRAGFGVPVYDTEGRVLITEHGGFTLVNTYFPSGSRRS